MKKKTKTTTPTTKSAPPDVDAIVKNATNQDVPIGNIDMEDSQFKRRESIKPACDANDIVIDNGLVDMSGVHPVVLRKNDKVYQIINGFRRIAALKEDPKQKWTIRCLVVNCSDNDASILASRINLNHGKIMSTSERRAAFIADYEACEAAGYKELSNCEWARIYAASPTTIGDKWIPAAKGESKKNQALQNGGSQQSDSASQGDSDVAGCGGGLTDDGEGESKGKVKSADLTLKGKTVPPRPKKFLNIIADIEVATEVFIDDLADRTVPTDQVHRIQAIIAKLQNLIPAHCESEEAA